MSRYSDTRNEEISPLLEEFAATARKGLDTLDPTGSVIDGAQSLTSMWEAWSLAKEASDPWKDDAVPFLDHARRVVETLPEDAATEAEGTLDSIENAVRGLCRAEAKKAPQGLAFTPVAGHVLMCRYDSREPEMTKDRRVIVVSTKPANRLGTCVVVPVNATEPEEIRKWHVEFPLGSYPCFTKRVWAKADMVGVVALWRLDRLEINGRWESPKVSLEDLRKVQHAVMFAMGIEADDAKKYVEAVSP